MQVLAAEAPLESAGAPYLHQVVLHQARAGMVTQPPHFRGGGVAKSRFATKVTTQMPKL